MTVRVFGRWWARPALVLLVAMMAILMACGGTAETATPASGDSLDATVSPPVAPSPVPSAAGPSADTASPTPAATPLAGPTVPVTPSPTLIPQTPGLKLQVTSPAEDMVVSSSSAPGAAIAVAGVTSPDATVSVNGVLAPPGIQGRFSVELPVLTNENPLSIEIIATSLSGEQKSVVRTVIFLP